MADDHSECVLVVDDERAIRDLVSRILSLAGYRVLTAASPEEAVQASEQEDVALVVTDINMPGSVSGLELIELLHARRPGLPIILITGADGTENLRAALDLGAAGFITKPFKAPELRERVAIALSRRLQAEVELRERVLAPTMASVLANAIEVRDGGMVGHAERLAALAIELGRRLSLPEPELEALEIGAVLHDVGKIAIPDLILLKPGPLTAEEWLVMKSHAEIGDRMLAPLGLPDAVRAIVRHHHERWDGTGYPDRLQAEATPILARLVAVADSIEAMSVQRPYRSPLGREAVQAELRAGRGTQWDPRVIDVALDIIGDGQLRFEADGMELLAS
jgi:putative nucleotidyltransferase with HDIG domain